MSIEKLRPSFTFTEDRIKELQAVVPEAFADGKINWETLSEALGNYLEDPDQEHYGLTWPGKRDARRLAAMPSKGTLVPQPREGVSEDTTRNIFIEGDNLEVLKLLQKSYAGKVKMIYIDPPYNTGHDFIYGDDYSEPLNTYLRRTRQIGEEGELLTTNTKSGGRFHSNWLSMMYPRMLLARKLLREDGALFVSIDDNESHNLKSVLIELFGEENFITTIVWQKVFAKKNKAQISVSHDYILVFTKDIGQWNRNLLPRTEEQLSAFGNPDNDPRGDWQSVSFSVQSEDAEKRKAYRYPISLPSGRTVMPPAGRHWNGLPERSQEFIKDNRIWFGGNGDSPPRLKVFLSEVQQGIVPDTWWSHEDSGNNQEAKKEIKFLFPGEEPFSTPKPTRLIDRILQIATNPNSSDLILDFFAGSSTTAHAILKKNSNDGGNRRFIMVQLPEPTRESNYGSIVEISKERIRRAIKDINNESENKLDFSSNLDLGFTSFKLVYSNFKDWQPYTGNHIDQLEPLFDHFESPLVVDWQPGYLLAEIMLLQGFPLDSRVIPLEEIESNSIQHVYSEFIAHELFICLDDLIIDETIQRLNLRPEDIFVSLDIALSDEAKISLADQCNLKVI